MPEMQEVEPNSYVPEQSILQSQGEDQVAGSGSSSTHEFRYFGHSFTLFCQELAETDSEDRYQSSTSDDLDRVEADDEIFWCDWGKADGELEGSQLAQKILETSDKVTENNNNKNISETLPEQI